VTELVDPAEIETIVGVWRHPVDHVARARSAEQKVYILHSVACVSVTADLRECPFSVALDRGIDLEVWKDLEDRPVTIEIRDDRVVPR
jgi:hypothetical protein